MAIVRVSPAAVEESALRTLGLSDAGVDLFSSEALAASLRRAASFVCPATHGRIVRSVLEVLEGLPGFNDETETRLESLVDALLGYGDLLELPTNESNSGGRRIFLGPPSFVRRVSRTCLLIGVRPDGAQLVQDELLDAIDYEGHVRMVHFSEALDELIASSGLQEVLPDQWLHEPRSLLAEEFVSEFEARLNLSRFSGGIENTLILDPATSVTYYKGRWRPPKAADFGAFVARRPQAYGADLWCFVRVEDGSITHLIDLPVTDPLVSGADEAWRLQAAIDVLAGHPQRVRVTNAIRSGMARLEFFSPLPSWMQRRLDILGTPLNSERGSLYSYRLPMAEADEELMHLAKLLWISKDDRSEGTNS